jgi:alkyl hydroperoxide reductase subunit D
MSVEALQELVPDYAKDLRLNVSTVARQSDLSEQQLWGLFVCCALTVRSKPIQECILPTAKEKLSEEAYTAALTAASLMGMNNIYYRFTHITTAEEYSNMPARLRMSGIAKHGIDKADFELWSLAASTITGCNMCVNSHEAQLREHGVSAETIGAAVRVAAVIHGIAIAIGEA